jgi:hypothetical protein
MEIIKILGQSIIAFFNGIYEFKLSFTTHYDDLFVADAYDFGREFAHIATFRKYEQ